MILLAILAAATPVDNLVSDYNMCIRRMATKLEPSGETPQTIADAAKVFCSTARFAAINQARNFKGGTAPSVSEIESAAEFYGRAQVVAARLCRKTGDCSLAKLP